MSKTIRQLALELHITKQAIYQRMDAIDNFRTKHTNMVGNRIVVDEVGEQLLINFEKIDKYDQKRQQEDQQEQKRDGLGVLVRQLSVKDGQIQALQADLAKQQQLQQAVLNENKTLSNRIQQLEHQLHHWWKWW